MHILIGMAVARDQGLRWYFTGKPCAYGHIARRRVSNRRCEDCEKSQVAGWRKANPEKVKEIVLAYRERHLERVREYGRIREAKRRLANPGENARVAKAWRVKNPDAFKAISERYRKNNPDVIRAANGAYRARKRGASGNITAAEFAVVLERQRFRCHWCGCSIRRAAQMDHVISLVHGGEHSAANVVGSCGACNRRKRSKDPIAWANELGRLF